MLAQGAPGGFSRVRGSARRLPFARAAFDVAIAVELFEHLHPAALDSVLRELVRVIRPGGTVAIIDKNAASWNARRPWIPNLALKWIDEQRGLWMYPRGGPVRERWFWPGGFAGRLGRFFSDVRVAHLLSPDESAHTLFVRVPRSRLLTLWSAHVPGGGHD
jgi:2-polyprenyl-6-hydroxyphenyl methylase/3-demethylubiquinone-9 3-methyltransferase